ncbi:hypothetical protein E0Z10_g8248 [Xylaria hypoxylon]|uniref:Uncharacterized protein n=1 Tax=Xylaria hypoxylon TaxID=37992 RepID=A0A4Z0Y9L5_9PEZI|nr:hypothetical protein E0Z10_g8248 [Xylaria hypoxylon]
MCVAAWNTAVDLECDFIEDIALMDTRVTLSLEALICKCDVAIWYDDMESMQRYLEDGRITGREIEDGRETEDDGTQLMGLLIERGYSLSKSDSKGNFPIHAAWDCEEDMIRLLLESGASLLDRDADGDSIWHLAVMFSAYNTLSVLLKLAGDEKVGALQMQNNDGFTPLTLAINTTIKKHITIEESDNDDEEVSAENVKLLLDACGRDASCWRCAGSPWDLAAQSGSAAVVSCLVESNSPLVTIEEGQLTPLHVLNGEASRECVELLMKLFPTANGLQYEGRTPLECFIYRCIEQCTLPHEGVIEALAYEESPTNRIQKNCSIWRYLCTDIICSKTLDYLKEEEVDSLYFIFNKCLQMKALEAYEESTGQCAAIPLLWSMLHGRIRETMSTDELKEVISRTKLWESACSAKEIIQYVKFLTSEPRKIHADLIHILLSNGVNIHLRIGPSSILEEVCRILECGGKYDRDPETNASDYALERRVFADIVDHANLEQLNAKQPTEGGYLRHLANRNTFSGTLWMIERLVAKGLDLNKPRVGAGEYPLLVLFLENSAARVALPLLELGADPLVTDRGGFDAAHAAAMYGNLSFLKSLLTKVQGNPTPFPWQQKTNITQIFGQSRRVFDSVDVLHLASLNGHTVCLQFFIDNNLISNAKSTTVGGYNCLHFAAINGNTETIKYLSSLGLDINQSADDGSLPIHFAVQNGWKYMVETLVELGSATYPDVFGITPRMYAEKLEYPHILECLEKQQTSP